METVLRQPGFPEIYERVLVPGIFAPWATDLIERARPIGPSDRILDLGCGTGVVARLLRERLGGGARITGVDVSPDMIEMARSVAPAIDWHVGNAMQLPFADGSFDLVISQQMLQFVPDRDAAAREIRRVLAPGGRLVLATWRDRSEQPLYETLGAIAERHLSSSLGPSIDRRFALGDPAELRRLFENVGFADIALDVVSRVDHLPKLPAHLVIAPMYDLTALTPEQRAAHLAPIEGELTAALQQFAAGDGFAAESRANFITARLG